MRNEVDDGGEIEGKGEELREGREFWFLLEKDRSEILRFFLKPKNALPR